MLDGSNLSALQAYQRAADQATSMHKSMMGGGDAMSLQSDREQNAGVFSRVFEKTIHDTREQISRGERMAQMSLTGDVPLEQLTAAVNQADLTLRTVVSLRDRFISAYQEVMRMQV